MNLFGDPNQLALLGLAQGMLQAGGPQRLPVGIGAAMGQGVQGALSNYMLGQQMQQQKRLADLQEKKLNTPVGYGPGTQLFAPGAQTPFYTVPFKPEEQKPPQAPQTRKVRIGGEEVTQEFVVTPEAPMGAWREVGRGPAFSDKPGVSVDVKVPIKVGESLANKVGDIASEGRNAASGAADIVTTVGRVKSALDSGNLNLGPGSTVLNKVDQVAQVLGVGGRTTEERLVNTRNVTRGLAQFALGARKQLKGQGQITEYEQKLLERAEAGNIGDFTVPELKDFLTVTDKLARKTHAEHKRIIGVMANSKDESVRGLVPYFDIPDLPAAPKDQPAPPKNRKYNPQTGRIE